MKLNIMEYKGSLSPSAGGYLYYLSYDNSQVYSYFEFEIELKDAEGNPANEKFYILYDEFYYNVHRDYETDEFEKIEFVDGKATVKLKPNYAARICDIPNGYEYTITEKTNPNWPLMTEIKIDNTFSSHFGSLTTFLNAENKKFNISLEALKKLENKKLEENQFEFELKDNNNNVIAKKKNDSENKAKK